MIDLHTHSLFSDGELVVSELARRAEAAGYRFIAVTDHADRSNVDLIVPRLVRGGLLVADNALSHQEELKSVLDRALADERVDALVVPIGKGLLVCRKL